jgi:sugar/nucleoside kinase (ribokinase family)
VSHRGEKIYRPGYQVNLADPCGSGDGFAAGFIHALLEGESLNQACRLGNALGAMVAQQEGATQPISYQEAMAFMESGPPGNVDRQLADYIN